MLGRCSCGRATAPAPGAQTPEAGSRPCRGGGGGFMGRHRLLWLCSRPALPASLRDSPVMRGVAVFLERFPAGWMWPVTGGLPAHDAGDGAQGGGSSEGP